MGLENLAAVFGRNANTEAFELEHDVKLWINLLVGPVLTSYFEEGPSAAIDRP